MEAQFLVARGPPATLCYLCQWLCQTPGYPDPLHCLLQAPYTHLVITTATGTVLQSSVPTPRPHTCSPQKSHEKGGTNCVCQFCSPGSSQPRLPRPVATADSVQQCFRRVLGRGDPGHPGIPTTGSLYSGDNFYPNHLPPLLVSGLGGQPPASLFPRGQHVQGKNKALSATLCFPH